jgi:1-deoxy-D-xylulose 5-phosphate reductoisomerase
MIIEPVAAGAGGSIFGAIVAWMGIKSRLDNIDRALGLLVSEKECLARTGALQQRVDNATDRFDRIDVKLDALLQHVVGRNKEEKK